MAQIEANARQKTSLTGRHQIVCIFDMGKRSPHEATCPRIASSFHQGRIMSAINPISHPPRGPPCLPGRRRNLATSKWGRPGRAGAHESLSSLAGDLFGARSESLLATLTFDFADQTAPTKSEAAGGGDAPLMPRWSAIQSGRMFRSARNCEQRARTSFGRGINLRIDRKCTSCNCSRLRLRRTQNRNPVRGKCRLPLRLRSKRCASLDLSRRIAHG